MRIEHLGPFELRQGPPRGAGKHEWSLHYATRELAVRTLDDDVNHRAFFAGDIERFVELAKQEDNENALYIATSDGKILGGFLAATWPPLTRGLPDDRSDLWIVTRNRSHSLDVTERELGMLIERHTAPQNHWIRNLLSAATLDRDSEDWRPPSAWEIRHVVGSDSFTGVSGADAAALVGVNAQSFRKYTAREGAKNRQSISFAMWHLLLHKLGVQNVT